MIADFWELFNKYCNSYPELAYKRKKWLLHRTGVKNVHLKFDPGRFDVKVGIELNHRSENRRLEMYEKMHQCKAILEAGFEDELSWELVYEKESGQEVCFIYTTKLGVDIHRKSQWTEIFEFMAGNMLILEENLLSIKEFI